MTAQARKLSTPYIDGETATFVWRGQSPPKLMGDFNGWDAETAIGLQKSGPQKWVHTMTLPRDAYMEYSFVRCGRRARDPNNPLVTPNGIGHFNNYFYMPEGGPPEWLTPRKGIKRGKITRHVIEAPSLMFGGKREVFLYQPPVKQPVPLLLVYDGQDYYRRAQLNVLIDNLIASGLIQPIALAMMAHGGQHTRMLEYGCSEMTLLVLQHVLLPLAMKKLNLIDLDQRPGGFGVLGASMGGLMALYTGLRMPGVFGKVISQSGAFEVGDGVMVTTTLIENGPVQPIDVWMDAGRYEWLLPANQKMHALLSRRGYPVVYREYSGGHNFPCWRNDLPDALLALFGRQKTNL